MNVFPLFAHLAGRRVLVVGGGPVAERKVGLLLQARAHVVLGAPATTPGLTQLARQNKIQLVDDVFHDAWLDGVWLVIAATDDRPLNRRIADLCEQRRIFINVVDDAVLSSVQVPAIVDRSPITIAISSAGKAPMLARRLRERIETLCDHSLGPLAALAGKYRKAIQKHVPGLRQRREFYDWLADGPVGAAIRARRPEQAESMLEHALLRPRPEGGGLVMLVGAGPGDPGLLTLNALRALNRADVILHDRLVSPEILSLARRDALLVPVGKSPGEDHDATQDHIHQTLLAQARAGRCVVRLKGGDPMIFGRGGEELEFLHRHGVRYEVVPGITAALACAAYAGVPLTHRRHAQSVRFVTAHNQCDSDSTDWHALAQESQTLAFYMGVGRLQALAGNLIAHGRAASTPFALVENGTRADQRVLTGTLGELPGLARLHRFKAPSLLLLGQTTALADTLHWFGARVDGRADTSHTALGEIPIEA